MPTRSHVGSSGELALDDGLHLTEDDRVNRRHHWDDVYRTREPNEVSWYQEHPERSMGLIARFAPDPAIPIIDVGGGASRLVDRLVAAGYTDVTVLDVAARSLERARERLGTAASSVTWITADITDFEPPRAYGVWHDRAVFHFLIEEAHRAAYIATLDEAVGPTGRAVIATFASDGPERCSGLPVHRYDPDELAAALAPAWVPEGFEREAHVTPDGRVQHFLYGWFTRPGAGGTSGSTQPFPSA